MKPTLVKLDGRHAGQLYFTHSLNYGRSYQAKLRWLNERVWFAENYDWWTGIERDNAHLFFVLNPHYELKWGWHSKDSDYRIYIADQTVLSHYLLINS